MSGVSVRNLCYEVSVRVGIVTGASSGRLYLASPASDYVTGQTLFVDGGWTAW